MTKSLAQQGRTPQNSLGAAKGLIPDDKLATVKGAEPTPTGTEPANQPANPAPVVAPITVQSPFGNKVITADPKGAADEPIVVDTVEKMIAMIAEESGADVKSLQDVLTKVLGPYKNLREEVSRIPDLENKVTTLGQLITEMPDDLKQAVNAWATGGNYQEVLSTQQVAKSIDFSKDFADHNEIKLINHFTKGAFTQESFTALEPNVQESLRIAARTQYDVNKRQVSAKPDLTKVVEARRQALIESVDRSVAALKVQFPDMTPDRVQEVRNTLISGGHNKRLYANDGTYKPNAAMDISMILYGSEAIAAQGATINQIMDMYQNKGASAATEAIVGRSDRPNVTTQRGGGTPNQDIAQKVKKATGFLHNPNGGEQF